MPCVSLRASPMRPSALSALRRRLPAAGGGGRRALAAKAAKESSESKESVAVSHPQGSPQQGQQQQRGGQMTRTEERGGGLERSRGGGALAGWPAMGGLSRLMANPYEIMRTDPFTLGDRLLHEMEQQMESMMRMTEGAQDTKLWAAVDVVETPSAYEMSTDCPGMKAADVKVSVQDGVLTIDGERKLESQTEGDAWKRVERSYGAFERRFKLPPNTSEEKVCANLENGVLRVTIPKKEMPTQERKEIPVQSGAAGSS